MQISLIKSIQQNLGLIFFFFSITLVAYGPSLNNQFVWDDEQFIYKNVYVINADVRNIFTTNTIAGAGESSTYYRPLTTLSFTIDHAIWGLNPFGFHLTNTLLHFSAGLLLFAFLRRIKYSKQLSIFVTTIFLIHPLQTEAVVYANSRGDSMYAFFAFATLYLFSVLITNTTIKTKIYDLELKTNKVFLSIATLITYILTILSKEIGIATIGLLFISFAHYNVTNKKTTSFSKIIKNNLLGLGVLLSGFLVALAYLLFRSKFIIIANSQGNFFAGTSYGSSIYTRLHTFTQALWKYFELIVVPYPLHMERNIPIIESYFSVPLLATIFLVITILMLIYLEYKKYKSTYLAFGSLWFIGMLVPVSGIIPVNGLIYEHWLYTPIVGFCIGLYAIAITIFSKPFQKKLLAIIKTVFPLLVIIYIGLTIRQNYFWGTPVRFYNYTLQFSESARLRNNLGMSYADEKRYEDAIENYHIAIEIADFYPQIHFNLANAYAAIGATDLAKQEYLTAIKMNDKFFPAYTPLVQIFFEEEKYENAAQLLEKLVEHHPENVKMNVTYAQVLLQLNETEKVREILSKLLELQLSTQTKLEIRDLLLQLK